MPPPHLLTLADLSVPQIRRLISHAHYQKQLALPWLAPHEKGKNNTSRNLRLPSQSLFSKTVALMFSKRSTRTRIAAETSATVLGGKALFLGKDDIQISWTKGEGGGESVRDTARVIGGMCQGIFARVGGHHEVEELAKYSPVPVINALSDLWHPTQILADLLTLHEHAHLFTPDSLAAKPITAPDPPSEPKEKEPEPEPSAESDKKTKFTKSKKVKKQGGPLPELPSLIITYVGDSANVLHDMLVTFPRLGHNMRVASPVGYGAPEPVVSKVRELGIRLEGSTFGQITNQESDHGFGNILWFENPKDAVKGADVVITDTWISMGQEATKAQRLKDFTGYQVTEAMCEEGGAKPGWRFLHCLPRKGDEVDDEVFYGPRSLVFPEADNRKWTIMAIFDLWVGRWDTSVEE
ncbi:ornithine carbamoyltransferase 1 [Armillaria solidipes]|uniref:ornithine carbamoyltransferase n=1 Tax=Armillaria solidipes TaxID=1076256 RepID=A0A2H3BXB2_9AGAR|nr:ornithine carbamoyltransferase 1 [Armillaria solidipes]